MNPLLKLQLRQGEARKELTGIVALEEKTEEQRSQQGALVAELKQLEDDIAAARVAEAPLEETRDDVSAADLDYAEKAEIRELRKRSRFANYILARAGDKPIAGADQELSAAFGIGDKVPVALFDPLERRAVTPGPTTAANVRQAPIVPALFDRSIAPWLGIEMPSAGIGDQAYPVLSTSVTAEPKAKDAAAPETAGAFTVTTVEPQAITGSFRVRYTDLARLVGMEEALRTNLGQVMGDAIDNQCLNGSGSGDGTINGLLNILTDPSAPAANAETWARYNTAFASQIDGLFAVDEEGVRYLVGEETYRHMAQQFRATESNESWTAYAKRFYGGVRATRRMPDASSNVQQCVVRRTNPAGDRVAVMPHWTGFDLEIRDHYTAANKREVVVTAIALVGDVVVLRSGAFVQDSFRLA